MFIGAVTEEHQQRKLHRLIFQNVIFQGNHYYLVTFFFLLFSLLQICCTRKVTFAIRDLVEADFYFSRCLFRYFFIAHLTFFIQHNIKFCPPIFLAYKAWKPTQLKYNGVVINVTQVINMEPINFTKPRSPPRIISPKTFAAKYWWWAHGPGWRRS